MQNYNNDDEFASVVTMKDVDRVKKMNKDELKKWVNQPCTFNHVIDHIRPIGHLRNQVIGLIKIRVGEEAEKRNEENKRAGIDVDDNDVNTDEFKMGWLLNPSNSRVFEATAELLKRDDFIPCEKNGKRL